MFGVAFLFIGYPAIWQMGRGFEAVIHIMFLGLGHFGYLYCQIPMGRFSLPSTLTKWQCFFSPHLHGVHYQIIIALNTVRYLKGAHYFPMVGTETPHQRNAPDLIRQCSRGDNSGTVQVSMP